MYFAFLLAFLIALPAFVHTGKTDRDGGHTAAAAPDI